MRPLTTHLVRRGARPNTLSLLSLPPAIAAGVAAGSGYLALSAGLMLLSGMLDLLDGAVARAGGCESRFGALLDSSLDRIVDACVPVGLVVFYAPYGAASALPVLALIAGFMVSYVRARSQSLELNLPRLWMRREDRFVVLIAALLLAPLLWPEAAIPAPLLLAVMGGLAVLGFIATASALRAAARIAAEQR